MKWLWVRFDCEFSSLADFDLPDFYNPLIAIYRHAAGACDGPSNHVSGLS